MALLEAWDEITDAQEYFDKCCPNEARDLIPWVPYAVPGNCSLRDGSRTE
ncbi:MAG: hypothetical protein ACE5LS_06345 [Thermoplasmata archaeon]